MLLVREFYCPSWIACYIDELGVLPSTYYVFIVLEGFYRRVEGSISFRGLGEFLILVALDPT